MSWTDKLSQKVIIQLQKEFKIKEAIFTGCHNGGDAELYSKYFENVTTCDIDKGSLEIAKNRLSYKKNINFYLADSATLISDFRPQWMKLSCLFYLDAHFFDIKALHKWQVVEELKALRNWTNAVIVIHDYDNGELGHLVYAGEHMGWNVVGEYIKSVNPNFSYYTNTKEGCEIVDEKTVKDLPIHVDKYILDNVKYANSSDIKRYRGILYATPKPLDLTKYNLRAL